MNRLKPFPWWKVLLPSTGDAPARSLLSIQCTTHKGWVVVAGPLRNQWRQARETQLQELESSLEQLSREIGQLRLRSDKAVQRRVNARVRNSSVGQFLSVTVNTTLTGEVKLFWGRIQAALNEAERFDGRYLLVTNDWSLSPQEMFRRYRQKDGVEKCFRLCKSDLQVSPLYLHQDKRISTMLFLNMIALLAYTLLQRQMQQRQSTDHPSSHSTAGASHDHRDHLLGRLLTEASHP
jgi:transposase